MAGKRIAKYTRVREVLGTDEFIVNQSGDLYKVDVNTLATTLRLLTGGTATGGTVLQIGENTREGLLVKVFDKTIDLHTTPANKWSLGFVLPANCVLMHAQIKLIDAITGAGGATAVSLGKDDPDTLDEDGQTSTLAANQQTSVIKFDNIDSDLANRTLFLFGTNGSGVGSGVIGGGAVGTEKIRVRMIYLENSGLSNL